MQQSQTFILIHIIITWQGIVCVNITHWGGALMNIWRAQIHSKPDALGFKLFNVIKTYGLCLFTKLHHYIL